MQCRRASSQARQVMEVAGITADPDGEQPHLLVEVDEEGEGDALTPA